MSVADRATGGSAHGSEWTPFASSVDAEPGMGFGRAELLYALLADPQPTAVRTAARLGYAETEVDDGVRLIGASALFAQGLLVSDDGDTFVPVREAALVSRAACTASAWITLGAVGDDAGEMLLGLVCDDALLLIGPGLLGGWVVALVPAGEHLLDVVGALLAGRLDASEPGGAPVAMNVAPTDADDAASSTLFIRRHPTTTDAFEVASGRGTASAPPILPGAKTGDEVDSLLAEALGIDPDTGVPLV